MANVARIDRTIRDLLLARACAQEGARISTIAHLTAISEKQLRKLLVPSELHAPRGRLPNTRDWFHNASLPQRIEASILMTDFEHSRALGFRAAESLVAAHRFHRRFFGGQARISFDRAFDLAAHTAGLWIASSASFRVTPCPACGKHRLHAACTGPVLDRCMFCKLIERSAYDKRLVAALPPVPLPKGGGGDWTREREAPAG